MISRISAATAFDMMQNTGVTIADIRDPKSFANAHITHSQQVDQSNLQAFVAKADKSKPLIVCCYHGISSQSAAGFFEQAGFNEVHSLDGGFSEWQQTYPAHCS